MQIVSSGDNLYEIQNLLSRKNKTKIFQNVVCWKFYLDCLALSHVKQRWVPEGNI